MSAQSTQHMVTIRLEEHVEQLERAYRAFISVRRQLDEAQHDFLQITAGDGQGGKLQAALGRLCKAATTVNQALHEFELPCPDSAAEPA